MLIQTEMFGTSVARALRVHADGMRIKRMQRAEEKAAMVGVKMTIPLILCILPSLMAVVIGPALESMIDQLEVTPARMRFLTSDRCPPAAVARLRWAPAAPRAA